MATKPRLVITGIAGLIGNILAQGLADAWDISGIDRRSHPDFPTHVADISDFEAIAPAFQGVHSVVHLAASAGIVVPWEQVLPDNIIGTYNVLESSRRAGVQRVVLASSNHTVGLFERDEPYKYIVRGEYDKVPQPIPLIDHNVPIRPDGNYGISKAFSEAAGRHFAEAHGLSIVCLRIGTVLASDHPENIRQFATLLTHRDCLQLFRLALKAPPAITFDIFYGVSNNRWRFWDLSHAREVIGYQPEDDTETFRSAGT